MSTFKVGDKVLCKPGGLDIWVKGGKTYEVLDIVVQPAEPGNPCYSNCGHPCHDPKPEKYWLVVHGEFDKPATIWEGCFEKSLDIPQSPE